jgi:integrase-like protein
VKFKSVFKREMTFENIDLAFYDDFMKYCLEKNYSLNTIGTFIKVIKMFMNEALDCIDSGLFMVGKSSFVIAHSTI